MTHQAIACRTLLAAAAVAEQQAREIMHCLSQGDAPGLLRAAIHLLNTASFLHQEAIDAEAAVARQHEEDA